jgi:hypothetical protein
MVVATKILHPIIATSVSSLAILSHAFTADAICSDCNTACSASKSGLEKMHKLSQSQMLGTVSYRRDRQADESVAGRR